MSSFDVSSIGSISSYDFNNSSFSSATSRGNDGANGKLVINGRTVDNSSGQNGSSVFNNGTFRTAGGDGANGKLVINGRTVDNRPGQNGSSVFNNGTFTVAPSGRGTSGIINRTSSTGSSSSINQTVSFNGNGSSAGTGAQPSTSSSRSFLASFNRG